MNEDKRNDYLKEKTSDYRSRIIASALASAIILATTLLAAYLIFNFNNQKKPIINPNVSVAESTPIVDNSKIDNSDPSTSLPSDNSQTSEVPSAPDESDESVPPIDDNSESNESSPSESTDDVSKEEPEESYDIIYGDTINNIYVWGDSAVSLSVGTSGGAERFIEVLNKYKNKLGENINLYTCIVPTYAEFYKNGDGIKVSKNDQSSMIEDIYSKLDENIIKVDAYKAISDNIDEYLYYRLDPNWTPLAAYYAYREIASAMNFEPVELDEYEKGLIDEYAGENYRNLKLPQLLEKPDTISFYKVDKLFPSVVNHYYTDGTERKNTQMVYASVSNPLSYGYMIYGDRGYYSSAITENKNGKKLLVLKDDSGTALCPFFMAHFEEVHIADIRYFKSYSGHNLDSFLAENDITDVLVLVYTNNARSTYRANNLEELLNETNTETEQQ